MVTEGRGNATTTIQLDSAIHDHCIAVTEVLDRIIEKSIKTFFRGQIAQKEEFQAKLNDLRAIRDGTLIMSTPTEPGGFQIRINVVDALDSATGKTSADEA
jgi:hypothetical protein